MGKLYSFNCSSVAPVINTPRPHLLGLGAEFDPLLPNGDRRGTKRKDDVIHRILISSLKSI